MLYNLLPFLPEIGLTSIALMILVLKPSKNQGRQLDPYYFFLFPLIAIILYTLLSYHSERDVICHFQLMLCSRPETMVLKSLILVLVLLFFTLSRDYFDHFKIPKVEMYALTSLASTGVCCYLTVIFDIDPIWLV